MPRFSAAWGMIGATLTYLVVLALDVPLFVYFPQTGALQWGAVATANGVAVGLGPAMHWYGLLADALIAGGVVGLIGRDRWLPAAGWRWLWLVPVLAIGGAVYLMRGFFVGG